MKGRWPARAGEMADRIRGHDWSTTSLGPLESWPESLNGAVDMMLACGFPMLILFGEERLCLYNDAYALLLGDRHPASFGSPLYAVWPEARQTLEPSLMRVWAGESVFLPHLPSGMPAPFGDETLQRAATPLHNAEGQVAAVLVTLPPTAEILSAHERLKHREERYRAFVTASADVVYRMSPDWSEMCELDGQGFIADTTETSEDWVERYILQADRASVQAAIEAAIRTRSLFELEHPVIRADGTAGWTLSRAIPMLGADGEIIEWLGAAKDVTERKAAEHALRESEERYRALFDAVDEGFCIVEVLFDPQGNAADYRFLQTNPEFERQTGLSDAVGKTMRELAPDHEQHWFEIYGRIALTGQAERFEDEAAALGRWYDVYAFRVGKAGEHRVAILFRDVLPRKRIEAALRESEDRQMFLLNLSDRLRSAVNPEAAMTIAARLFAQRLGLSVAHYLLFYPDEEGFDVVAGYSDGRLPEKVTRQSGRISDHGPGWGPQFRKGEAVFSDDHDTRPPADAKASRALGIRSGSAVPLIRNGRLVGMLSTAHPEPRRWTEAEKSLQLEVAERTWDAVERVRAEARLRDSEERFAQYANASSGGIWIRDAATLAMEYVSPAVSVIYGVQPAMIRGGVEKWAAMIVPEDRGRALEHIERARQGESVVHEFRIQRPSDRTFRWIRNTEFPLYLNGRVQRIGGIADDVTEEKLAVEHQGVLLGELQHRVRNTMAIIQSILARTAEGATSVEDFAELLSGRLLTLARLQALLTRAANAGVPIATIMEEELAAQAPGPHQFEASGPNVILSPKAAETMTLAVHELTTNALKHGAFSSGEGKVTASWKVMDRRGGPWLIFDWRESGVRPAGERKARRMGFGSELIESRIPYELGGNGSLTIEADGARCHLEFPLAEGASVLETDAPQRMDVFGGGIDMAGAADLSGQRILVVEDDYYLASDTARALAGAGADVVGPYPSERAAYSAVLNEPLTGALLDINLNGSRSFGLARKLAERKIPFIFMTGYDQQAIPAEFQAVPRLQKPVDFKQIVAELARLLGLDTP